MRIEKKDDGWWIIDVPPYVVDGVTYTGYGPYRTKAEALDDKRGLSDFFVQNPDYATGEKTPETGTGKESYSRHWFVKSLSFKSPRLRGASTTRAQAGQLLLPGISPQAKP